MEKILRLVLIIMIICAAFGCFGLAALMVFAVIAPPTMIMWILLAVTAVLLFHPNLMASVSEAGALFLFCYVFGKYLWIVVALAGVALLGLAVKMIVS